MSRITLHSGAFQAKDDTPIRVTFYKEDTGIEWANPIYQYMENNIFSGAYVSFAHYFNYTGTIAIEPSQYVASYDSTTMHFIQNTSDVCMVFDVTVYIREDDGDRLTIRFNMMPQSRLVSEQPAMVTFDGHQSIKPVSLSTAISDDSVVMTEIDDLNARMYDIYYPDVNWESCIGQGEGDNEHFYPDLSISVNDDEDNRVWWYVSRCQHPMSSGTRPANTYVGGLQWDFLNDTISHRAIPVVMTSLTNIKDACVAKIGTGDDDNYRDVRWTMDAAGGFLQLYVWTGYYVTGEITELPPAELVDYDVEFIDLKYGTDWIGYYDTSDEYHCLWVDGNDTGHTRCVGIRVNFNDDTDNWAECLLIQPSMHNLYVSPQSLISDPEGDTFYVVVWSTTGDAMLADSQYDWIEFNLQGSERIPGTDYNIYTYEVMTDANFDDVARTGKLRAVLEGVSTSVIYKDITVTQYGQ